MKNIVFILFLFLPVMSMYAEETPTAVDSVEYILQQQLMTFPHEKIYVQTDKAGYLSGERIWFRAHMVDALSHQSVYISRYIYLELIGPLDDLVHRVKVRPDSTGAYHGYIDLEEDLAQGDYTIRAYTQYMRNRSEEYFFRRHIQVLDPFSLQLEPLVNFDVDKNEVNISLQFIDRQLSDTIEPEIVTYKIGHNAIKTIKPKSDNVYQFNERLSDKNKNRTLLLGIIYNGRKYNRYYTIPRDQEEYDLQFFPEGGSIIPRAITQVAFKALGTDGIGINIKGTLYDSSDNEILKFNSQHLGMGLFHFIPSENETYHVICQNEYGVSKLSELPASQPAAYAINTRNIGNQLRITYNRGEKATQENVSLLIHHKGLVLLNEEWKPNNEMFRILNNDLPTGILNILLLNSKNEVLSERLYFNHNNYEFAQLQSETQKPTYKRRELISIGFKLTDQDLTPISGNMAVSVTDKKSVLTDSTINIISTLLLSSELRGNIESSASYFQDGKLNKQAIDILMLTQGWRRYDIPAVLQGKIKTPEDFEPELAQKITGKADGLFRGLNEGEISLIASLDTMISTQVTLADEKGQFSFDMEYPEGTQILVQSLSKRGGSFNVINLNQETFPSLEGSSMPLKSKAINRHNTIQDSYLQLANEDYTLQNGIRTIMLEEFTVTAKSLEKYKESVFYSPIHASGVQTAEDIERMNYLNLRSLLQRQSGIIFRGDIVSTNRSELPVLFVIDNIHYEDFAGQIDNIEVSSIESIFVLKDNTSMPGYFPNNSGAVVITTKKGDYNGPSRRPPNIDEIIPLGYQHEATFYTPTYETTEDKESTIQDLRTTIYWKPNVQFSEHGEAIIDFYSADTPGVYQVTGEGVSLDGKLIYINKEITIESSNVH